MAGAGVNAVTTAATDLQLSAGEALVADGAAIAAPAVVFAELVLLQLPKAERPERGLTSASDCPFLSRRCGRRKPTASALGNRFLDESEQDAEVDVGQPLDIQAGLAGLVFAEPFKERFGALKARRNVNAEVALATREPDEASVTFVTAGVPVVVAAKSDDARTPRSRARSRTLTSSVR